MGTEQIFEIITALSNNVFILMFLIFLYATTNFEIKNSKYYKQVLSGLVLALAALFIMSNPYYFEAGINFDTRTILFSIAGVFFGPLATIVAGVIAMIYRLIIGGSGVPVGIISIAASAFIGIIWNKLVYRVKFVNRYMEYYIFGLIIHAITILIFLFLPNSLTVIRVIAVPFLVIFPIVSMFIGVLMEQQHQRISNMKLNQAQQQLLQFASESNNAIEIYALDQHFNYIAFNIFHHNEMLKYYHEEIEIGDNFIKLLNNDIMKKRYSETFTKVLYGESVTTVTEVEDVPGKYIEEIFTPIYRGKEIIGITVFVRNVTEQKEYEKSIIQLSYHDALTGAYNRRFFIEKSVELRKEQYEPLSLITCDVNGLKLINDTFGHRIGDEVLVRTTKILMDAFNDLGYVFRMGGDEFIILAPHMRKDMATKIMESVLEYLDKEQIHGVKLSLSYGISTKENDEQFRDIARISEELMYRHKLFENDSHRSEFIKTILQSLHEKNPREEAHSKRVARICIEIGKKLNMNKDELNLLRAISSLHDIGKIAIDEAILNKPGKLTAEEWEIVKRHPEIGYRIIAAAPEYSEIATDILSHHERWDGNGYPRGLMGEDIPIRARIVSIADSYDAMISKRTYREPLPKEVAIEEIKRCSGSQFDPTLVDIFLDIVDHAEKTID